MTAVEDQKKQFLRFLLSGGIAAGANIVSRYVFSMIVSYEFAIVLAYIVGMVTAFLLFKCVVFEKKAEKPISREVLWFVIVNAFAVLQTYCISIALAEHVFPWIRMTWYPYDIAHIVGVGFPVVTSYLGHKYITFGGKKNAADQLG